jgi:serine/threonine protein kinase
MIQISNCAFESLRTDQEFALYRAHRDEDGSTVLVLVSMLDQPPRENQSRLEHEYLLRDELDADWAALPINIARLEGRPALLLKDPGPAVTSLEALLGNPLELGQFLHLAINLAAGLGKLHRRGLVHKDIKPGHLLVDSATKKAWLTGFGISSRLARERQAVEPPEVIAGTLAYMAPEQTGRMNRSIDSRSDLYSLGVTFYQMLTGSLPFTASEPMEWVHCHIARQPPRPSERRSGIPEPISAIVLKLLAKTAEERYQIGRA